LKKSTLFGAVKKNEIELFSSLHFVFFSLSCSGTILVDCRACACAVDGFQSAAVSGQYERTRERESICAVLKREVCATEDDNQRELVSSGFLSRVRSTSL
jgi:hypothetical protein